MHLDRPREVRWFHAGAMLYGDWGTSRLYVLGLAFYFSAHASIWYLAAMSALVLAVAWAYSVICRLYPDGGGVYSAAKRVSRNLAVLGALLLTADYVVTASLSALEAFHYFKANNAPLAACASIAGIGLLNAFGPKRVGVLALAVAACAIVLNLVLAAFALPHLGAARVEPPPESVGQSWRHLVDIVLALSGVEAIANMTGVMAHPVHRTSRLAIWPVAIEVAVLNLVLGLAMNAVPGLSATEHKEDMLHALSEHFVSPAFADVSSFFFGVLLLSAANTAIGGLVSIQYLLSRDRELPAVFSRLNRYGVPTLPVLVATAAPILVLALESDLVNLAALYAIGVVGAITINLGTCVLGKGLAVGPKERVAIAALACVMFAIEATVAVEKPNAVLFAAAVLATGFALRAAARTWPGPAPAPAGKAPLPEAFVHEDAPRMLLAMRSAEILPRALEAAAERKAILYALFVREVAVPLTDPAARPPALEEDAEARALLAEAKLQGSQRGVRVSTLYGASSSPEDLILETAATLGVENLFVGTSRRSRLWKFFKGDVLRYLAKHLPPGTMMTVVRA